MFPSSGKNVNMWYFLWDNSPIHRVAVCKQWLHNNGVTVVDLSPYSPECNIIEHIWWDVKRRVEERECKNEKHLIVAWEVEWTKTDPDFVLWLVRSMPLRIQALIKADGGHIPFILPHNPKSKHKLKSTDEISMLTTPQRRAIKSCYISAMLLHIHYL